MDSRHRARLFPLVFDVITYSWSFTSCVRYQPFPEMFCAMDADQYELIFYRKGGSFVAIEAHANLAREEFFDGPGGKIAQREIVVQQLDD